MGNFTSRRRPVLKDCSTNTETQYHYLYSLTLYEIKRLESSIGEIEVRLKEAEKDTELALKRLKDQDLRSYDIIRSYQKLVFQIRIEKDKVIEDLRTELAALKEEESDNSNSECTTWV